MYLSLYLIAALALYANASVSQSKYGIDSQQSILSEMVRNHGYPFEEHEVTTPDGYVIIIHRIPHGRQQQIGGGYKKTPVFLQHGLLSSSDSWLMNQPEISLPYLLADAGYDVWMGNTRGNTYGRKHMKMNPEQPEFWDFSFDEIAKHDLPSMINYVVKITDVPVENIEGLHQKDGLGSILSKHGEEYKMHEQKPRIFKKLYGGLKDRFGGEQEHKRFFGAGKKNPQGKLHYIGHSEGSLLGFVQFGRDKDLASKISVFVALSPIGKVGYGISQVSKFLKNYDVSSLFNQPEVFSNKQLKNYIVKNICGSGLFDELCKSFEYSLPSQMDKNVPFLFSHFPAGTSRKNLVHYSQLAKSGNLQAFDYGTPEKNQFYYKKNVPPQYSLKDVNVPVVLFYGNKDLIVSDKDYENLKEILPNIIYHDLVDSFGHLDFVFHKNAKDRVYDKLIDLLSKHQQY